MPSLAVPAVVRVDEFIETPLHAATSPTHYALAGHRAGASMEYAMVHGAWRSGLPPTSHLVELQTVAPQGVHVAGDAVLVDAASSVVVAGGEGAWTCAAPKDPALGRVRSVAVLDNALYVLTEGMGSSVLHAVDLQDCQAAGNTASLEPVTPAVDASARFMAPVAGGLAVANADSVDILVPGGTRTPVEDNNDFLDIRAFAATPDYMPESGGLLAVVHCNPMEPMAPCTLSTLEASGLATWTTATVDSTVVGISIVAEPDCRAVMVTSSKQGSPVEIITPVDSTCAAGNQPLPAVTAQGKLAIAHFSAAADALVIAGTTADNTRAMVGVMPRASEAVTVLEGGAEGALTQPVLSAVLRDGSTRESLAVWTGQQLLQVMTADSDVNQLQLVDLALPDGMDSSTPIHGLGSLVDEFLQPWLLALVGTDPASARLVAWQAVPAVAAMSPSSAESTLALAEFTDASVVGLDADGGAPARVYVSAGAGESFLDLRLQLGEWKFSVGTSGLFPLVKTTVVLGNDGAAGCAPNPILLGAVAGNTMGAFQCESVAWAMVTVDALAGLASGSWGNHTHRVCSLTMELPVGVMGRSAGPLVSRLSPESGFGLPDKAVIRDETLAYKWDAALPPGIPFLAARVTGNPEAPLVFSVDGQFNTLGKARVFAVASPADTDATLVSGAEEGPTFDTNLPAIQVVNLTGNGGEPLVVTTRTTSSPAPVVVFRPMRL